MRARPYDPNTYDPQHSYAAKQLSRYDMQVAGVVVYVVAMTFLFVVALVMMLFRNEPLTQAQAHARKPAAVVRITPADKYTDPRNTPVARRP